MAANGFYAKPKVSYAADNGFYEMRFKPLPMQIIPAAFNYRFKRAFPGPLQPFPALSCDTFPERL